MGPIRPSDSNQPRQPVNGPQQAQPAQPVQQPQQSQEAKPCPPDTQAPSGDQSTAQTHQSANIDPTSTSQQDTAAKIEAALSEPQDLEALAARLTDANPNDVQQVKQILLANVDQALGRQEALNLGRKLNSTAMVPDPDNKGQQIPRAKLYDRIIQSYINDFKSASPEQKAQALQQLAHVLAGGAVHVLNDDDAC
ncbi:MAG: hypothetical protein ACAI44_38955 [Candidatus Sericytochromatia bacterium]